MDVPKYEQKATEEHPTLLIILIDQSTSMERILAVDEKNDEAYSLSRMAKIMTDNSRY